MLLFQCSPSGLRTTLHPLLNGILKAAAGAGETLGYPAIRALFARQGIDDDEAIGIFSFLLGAGGPNAGRLKDASKDRMRERSIWAAQRCLELMSAGGPMILAIEDAHWLDPTSRDLVEAVARSIRRFPVLLIATSRTPWPGWQKLEPRPARIALHGLAYADTRRVMEDLLPGGDESSSVQSLEIWHQMTGGVPLFIEEFCRWKAENAGRTDGGLPSVKHGSEFSTFESILTSRLEAIGGAKEIASGAAVIGRSFEVALLRQVLPGLAGPVVQQALAALCDGGILVRSRVSGAPAYGFRHSLFQETIYSTILRKNRRSLHQRVFSAIANDNSLAPGMGPGALAEHAEAAEQFEDAVALYTAAGKNSFALSATVEARQLLEHGLELAGRIGEAGAREALKLSVIAALGPVLTNMEGSTSPRARGLYEEAVEIARGRPATEQAKWFPIYWGWWFTGADFAIQRQRAQAVLSDLSSVTDADVQLQVRHCIWAIEFNVGRHDSCLAAVDAGLDAYQAGHGAESLTLYGGHDARVCGLAQKALSLWFVGREAEALQAVAEARGWADRLGHAGSIAHACDFQAMLHRYRRDFHALRAIVAGMRSIAAQHHLPSLAAKSRIFEGWCIGLTDDPHIGKDMIEGGLAALREIETVEDFPVYCDMHVELLALCGDVEAGLALLAETIAEAERAGHAYWLAELYHRRARLLAGGGLDRKRAVAALDRSLGIAVEQNAVFLLLGAYETLRSSGLSPELEDKYRDAADNAARQTEAGSAGLDSSRSRP